MPDGVTQKPISPWGMAGLIAFLVLILAFITVNIGASFDPSRFVAKGAPKEDQFSRDYINLVLAGKQDQVVSLLSPEIRKDWAKGVPGVIRDMRQMGEPVSIRLFSFSITKNLGDIPKKTELNYYLDFKKGSMILRVLLSSKQGVTEVEGFRYDPINTTYEQCFQFGFWGKSFLHYGVLLLAMAVFIFTIATFVKCARSDVSKKWGWMFFIMLGAGRMSLFWEDKPWTDLHFQFQPLYVMLFSSGFLKDPIFEPWKISVAIPLGAILYYFLAKPKIQPSN